MKVPIRYKSSDRYNAGVDVVYDDESKLQYAPFVYATTASGDSGGSQDEEGEDVMFVNISSEGALDKTWKEIKQAVDNGHFVVIKFGDATSSFGLEFYYIDSIVNTEVGDTPYRVNVHNSHHTSIGEATVNYSTFSSSSEDGALTTMEGN